MADHGVVDFAAGGGVGAVGDFEEAGGVGFAFVGVVAGVGVEEWVGGGRGEG